MWAVGDAAADGVEARANLGDHAAVDGAVGQQGVELVGRGGRQPCAGIVAVPADAVDVGQVDELGGPDRLGDGSGDGVGVDVVGLPGWRRCRWWRRPG